jgi:ribosomal protein L7Ae-like RNA K-turn-binding protein
MEFACHVTGKTLPAHDLLRFCVSPAGELTPDIGNKLPGAHIWVSARQTCVAALQNSADWHVPEDLPCQVAALLGARARNMLGLARAAGKIVLGFAKVEAALSGGRAAMLVSAHDGAQDGRAKLARKAQAAGVPVLEVFSADELGLAMGRQDVIHSAVTEAQWAAKIDAATRRWQVYIGTVPSEQSGGQK